jgi:hypothetical protein
MWYVYDKATSIIQKTCKTRGAAKGWITRRQKEFLKAGGFGRYLYASQHGPFYDWSYADAQYFHEHIEKSRTVRNLMTGEPVTISANTPRSCDPSSELYWVM